MFPPASGGSVSKAISISFTPDSPSKGGNVIVAQTMQETISDLTSWFEVWNTYLPVIINDQPKFRPSLIAYQSIVYSANKVSLPQQWLEYDERFRKLVSTEPMTLWNKHHEDLWLDYIPRYHIVIPVRHTQSSWVLCMYCNSTTQFPENCFQNPFRRQPRGGTISKDGGAIPHSQFHSSNSTPKVHKQPRLGSSQLSPNMQFLQPRHVHKAELLIPTEIPALLITYHSNALVGNILEYEKLVTSLQLHQFEHEVSSHPN